MGSAVSSSVSFAATIDIFHSHFSHSHMFTIPLPSYFFTFGLCFRYALLLDTSPASLLSFRMLPFSFHNGDHHMGRPLLSLFASDLSTSPVIP